MKKILILIWKPIIKRKIEIFKINSLKKNYKIYFCDVSKIIFPKYKNKITNNYHSFKFKKISKLSIFLKKNSFDLIFNLTDISKKSKLYKLLLSLKIPILKYYETFIGTHNFYPKRFYYILKNFFYLKIFTLFKRKNFNEYSYLTSDNIHNPQDFFATNIIYGKNLIFDELPNRKIRTIKKKIVFLDQNWGYNFDYNNYSKSDLTKFKLLFYKDLKKFLKNLEKELKVNVIIALHPSAEQKNLKIYKGFKVSRNNIVNEILSSKLVIGCWSTSLDYAIILRKKILVISSEYFKLFKSNYEFTKLYPKLLNHSLPLLISEKKYFEKKDIEKFIIKPNINYKFFKEFFFRTKNNTSLSFNCAIKSILNKNFE